MKEIKCPIHDIPMEIRNVSMLAPECETFVRNSRYVDNGEFGGFTEYTTSDRHTDSNRYEYACPLGCTFETTERYEVIIPDYYNHHRTR